MIIDDNPSNPEPTPTPQGDNVHASSPASSQHDNSFDSNADSEIPNELLNEKFDTIMSKLEQLNIEKEIGEKEQNADTRIIIDSIELTNFKSYADKKVIGPLHYRFNAVVGPNGSGKSNLMESLLFVFGKRAKKMRLHKLSELIHSSSTHNACRSAKVSIRFREIKETSLNAYHFLPNGDFTLTREVHRNSSSKYALNGSEITFDELTAVLSKKGIDLKHNRFLILQGEVEQISMMKQKASGPNETGLLEFLEDIIGTNRYVPLIEKLSSSIEELTEVKNAKVNRVKITKRELDDLEDVKNQSTEYYHSEKKLHILKHLELHIQKEESNVTYQRKQSELAALEAERKGYESEIRAKMDENSNVVLEFRKIKKREQELKKHRDELNRQSERMDEDDKLKRDDIEMYTKQIKKNEIALEKLNRNYQSTNESIANAKDNNPKLKAKIEEFQLRFDNVDKEISLKEKEIFTKSDNVQRRKKELQVQLQPSETEINNNKFKIEQNASTIKLISSKIDGINRQIEANEHKKQTLHELINTKQEQLRNIDASRIDKEATKLDLEKQKVIKEKAAENKHREVQQLLSKISDMKSSSHERTFKDKILQQLLSSQNEGKLKGILGRLGDLGSIDSKYDCAITTACSYLDSIVVESVKDAEKAVEYLKKMQIGQATFMILDKIKWVENNMHRPFTAPPNTYRLFDLVKYNNSKLQTAFYFALRDTLVAPDIKIAKQIAYGSTRYRVVTLSGELIEIYGTIAGGGRPKTGGMSNVEKEYMGVSASEKELDKLNALYTAAVKEYEDMKMELSDIEHKYAKTNSALQEVYVVKSKTENELAQVEKALKEITLQSEVLSRESAQYSREKTKIDELNRENDELVRKNKSLLSQSESLRAELAKINNEIELIMGDDYNAKKEERSSLKCKIEEMEKEINKNENILKSANETLAKAKKEIETKEKSKSEFLAKIEDTKKYLEQLEKDAMVLYGEIESCDKEIEENQKISDDTNKNMLALKEAIKVIKDKIEKNGNDVKDVNEEMKKISKVIASKDEDIEKNKQSFNKLVTEFGFIEEFDKDIKDIQTRRAIKKEDDNDNDDNEENDNNSANNDNDNDDIPDKPTKQLTPSSLSFQRYFIEKTLRNEFTKEELQELISFTKDISYTYLMLQTQLNNMKPNMSSILQYKSLLITLKEKEEDLQKTTDKLQRANNIYLNVKSKRYNEFMEGFNIISSKLKEMYQLITNGGDAELELVDTLDPFNEGISFSVRPSKKSWKNISNLSGGEKTLSSLSLIFALHHYKPSPLYILDEIDAALDFRNVAVIANYIKAQAINSQFIIISHRNHMFELANKLVGIYKTFDISKTITYDPTENEESREDVEMTENHEVK